MHHNIHNCYKTFEPGGSWGTPENSTYHTNSIKIKTTKILKTCVSAATTDIYYRPLANFLHYPGCVPTTRAPSTTDTLTVPTNVIITSHHHYIHCTNRKWKIQSVTPPSFIFPLLFLLSLLRIHTHLSSRYFCQGGYVTGLYIEGARWNIEHNSLAMSLPNILTEPLPILAIIPIEEHRLELQVCIEWNRTGFSICYCTIECQINFKQTIFCVSLAFYFGRFQMRKDDFTFRSFIHENIPI